MIKQTSKWVYYTCAKCGAKKFISVKNYKGEQELTCFKCRERKTIKPKAKTKVEKQATIEETKLIIEDKLTAK